MPCSYQRGIWRLYMGWLMPGKDLVIGRSSIAGQHAGALTTFQLNVDVIQR
jgi:hypothetical protein